MAPDITLVHALFINKDPVEKKIMTPYFPLGLMYLGAVLRERGYEIEMFDCTFREDYQEFEEYMQRVRPPVVGITALITVRKHALVLADIAHRYGATVIMGGPDPTGIPERYLHFKNEAGEHPGHRGLRRGRADHDGAGRSPVPAGRLYARSARHRGVASARRERRERGAGDGAAPVDR